MTRSSTLERFGWIALGFAIATNAVAQNAELTVHARLQPVGPASLGSGSERVPPAVLWLKPHGDAKLLVVTPGTHYALLQQHKMFRPHLLVVPVGAVVEFPNRDPFFHNVFSLFEGKRFDLGLYEAGRTKNVIFSREGISYIFCNIHPEMSAVVISLATPFYAVADNHGEFHIRGVTPGDYNVHLWVEGQPQSVNDASREPVHIARSNPDLGTLFYQPAAHASEHKNKFGEPYASEEPPKY